MLRFQIHHKALPVIKIGTETKAIIKRRQEEMKEEQWAKCLFCKQWRELLRGSAAWPKKERFDCQKIGINCNQPQVGAPPRKKPTKGR